MICKAFKVLFYLKKIIILENKFQLLIDQLDFLFLSLPFILNIYMYSLALEMQQYGKTWISEAIEGCFVCY